ncbi:MAG: patatin family protein [Lachnospiraceae bacterium]|nr:patatin family protein [Lachnospiraceae bacterium]
MKKGIVMEGGAMRGMFTCGIIDVLLENKIGFDGAVGVSAGATFGCNLKSGQHGRPLRYNKKYCRDRHYHSIRSLLMTGDIYNVKFCYDDLPCRLDVWDTKAFAENPMEFYVVATDVNTGKPVYHKCTDGGREDMNWIRASASMPAVSRPVHIGEGIYLDGGTSDSIPLRFMEEKGYDRILVIETQPKDFIKKKQKYMKFIRLALGKYPEMIKAMENRYIMYNREKQYIREREETGEVIVIRPEAPLNISPVERDENELQRVYDLGREAGLKNIGKIKKL